MIVGLLALFGLFGCQAPGAIAPTADTRPVTGRFHLAGFHVESVLSANTAASIDHLRLKLLMKDTQGVYQATGAVTSVPAASLSSTVSLGNLKIGKQYRVQADAYADAAETQLISVASGSVTDFTTPSIVTTAGVASLSDTPIALALSVKLADKTYAGTGTFTVSVNSNLRSKVDQLRVTLYQVDSAGALTQRFQKSVAYAGANPSFTLTNMRSGTSYRLLAEAFSVSGGVSTKISVDANSTLDLAVPAPTSGQLDDNVNTLLGVLAVNCSK
jgi:hypothetical protein